MKNKIFNIYKISDKNILKYATLKCIDKTFSKFVYNKIADPVYNIRNMMRNAVVKN